MATSFEQTMRAEVRLLADELSIGEDRAFAVWYAMQAFRLDENEALEATSYDGGNDRGIDIFYVDDEGERVVIGQTKYFKSSTKNPRPGDITLLLNTVNELADPQELRDAGREDLASAADDYEDARSNDYSVQMQCVYPGRPNDELARLVRTFNRKSLRDNISASILTTRDLELIYEDHKGASGRVPSGSLALQDGSFEHDGSFGQSLVASIPGTSLKALYSQHGNRLFDQNVRLFLGARKGSVNAGLAETLGSTDERGHFWAYNNGITIVARRFKVNDDRTEVEMTDFSVVNGCQTTVSIAQSSDAAAADVSVLARVVASKPELVDSIIRFTNSQTPIKLWDLSARDKLQRRLQKDLDELSEPWFYALRRGELETHPTKDRYGVYGSRRVLEFPLTAQYLAAARGLPVEAYKDKAKLFTVHRDKVFPNDTSADDVLWAWSLGQAAEAAIKTYKSKLDVDDDAAAILRRGARFFVTAVAAQLLRARNGDDVFAKVSASRLNDKKMSERLEKYSLMAVSYYVTIMRTMVAGGTELSTLLKSGDTSVAIEKRVKERMFEQELAPKALDEALPKLPGIAK